MATPTYIPLATITLPSPSPSVTFTGISQDYSDLIISVVGNVTARTGQTISLNGSTGGFTWVYALGNGTTASSSTGSNNQFGDVWENSSTNLSSSTIQIMDYSATDKHKTILTRTDNGTPNGAEMRVMRKASTAAVTSVEITASSTTWIAGTKFALFGIHGEVV
jgi:hypothetical protein